METPNPSRQLPTRPVETRMTSGMDKARERIDQLVLWMTASDEPEFEGTDTALGSVRRPLRIGIVMVLATLFVTLVWGGLVPMESAVLAHGSVVVLNNRKTVQHLEGGVIRELLVKEGDVVKEGQPLVLLNDVAARASFDITQRDLLSAKASETRLLALLNNKDTLEYDPALVEASQTDTELAKTLQTQRELFDSQRSATENRRNVFRQRMAQVKEEISGLQSQLSATVQQLDLIGEELTALQTLLEQGLVPKPRVLEMQRRQEELRGSRGQLQAAIAKAKQNISENENQLANEENTFAQQISTELRDIEDRRNQATSKVSATQDVMKRTTIVSPADGIVTGLKQHTVGGVITPGSPIMDIVPQNEELVIEAKVQPSDIDVVHSGQQARVVLSAYKTRNMPKLDGKVLQVSADAFTEQAGLQSISYYTVRVEVDGKQVASLQETAKLSPGMPAEVYVVTGKRTFLSYLFRPITDSMHKAFREE